MERNIRPEVIEEFLKPYEIQLGAPLLDYRYLPNFSMITVPRLPHLFYVQHLSLEEDGAEVGRFQGVMVLAGHSIVTGVNLENWKFLYTGKSVLETVQAYEEAQSLFDLPPIDALLACRQEDFSAEEKTIFTYRKQPYIVPVEKAVTIHNNSEDGESRSTLVPGVGVDKLVMDAGKWDVDLWKSHHDGLETSKVPSWAVNASAFSLRNLVDPQPSPFK